MDIIDVLIVEDESNIAELHAHFINKTFRFKAVGIAGNLAEARTMIRILKPKLILLDNYLPDGQGLNLIKDLIDSKNSGDIIFITAASDMVTVREAVRSGVFDYLLKPIAYDRLQDTLNRYLKYTNSLKSTDRVNQRLVDDLFNFQSRDMNNDNLPKGIDELTLNKVKAAFKMATPAHTADSLSTTVQISKTTSRRYLEYCTAGNYLIAKIEHGRVGRPERVYYKSEQ
ncbi:MAG: two-component response regulator DpiA [Moritella sp.]|uniref:two-component response regulator DpiA n=1 Tax=Moritella sp. TaxID=78556 RepID=UPI001DA6511E|nr:two-component response regulator DpiA [Moritella sp.]NQZ48643.1 two-component response regulator DpiA [Moritella sp.]